jgi:hypothetical protein
MEKVRGIPIASAMLVVAIAAVDFGVIRAGLEHPSLVGGLLLLGALPMANVLALALLFGRLFQDDRPFILGFAAGCPPDAPRHPRVIHAKPDRIWCEGISRSSPNCTAFCQPPLRLDAPYFVL